MNGTQPRRNRAIDALRFAAAFIVVASHMRLLFFEDYADSHQGLVEKAFYLPSSLGTEAVLVFFVLSGYWVGGSIIRQWTRDSFHVGKFALARLTRLWIVLIPALAVTFLLDRVGKSFFGTTDVYSHPEFYAGIDPDPSHSVLTLLGNLAFVQEIRVNPYGFNHPLWSLAYEFWYYVIFASAAVLFGFSRSLAARMIAVLIIASSCLIVGSSVLALSIPWLLGAAASWLAPRISFQISQLTPFAISILRILNAAALFASMLGSKLLEFQILGVFAIGLSTASFLILLQSDINARGYGGRLLTGASNLADSSYSLYAIHMPLLVLTVAAVGPNFNERWSLNVGTFAVAAGLLVGSVCVSMPFAKYTERRTGALRARFETAIFGHALKPRISTPSQDS